MSDRTLPSDDQVRALTEEVLARPEYVAFRRRPTEVQELVSRFADWLDRHFGWLPDRIESNWDYLTDLLLALVDGLFADDPLPLLARFVLGTTVLVATASGLFLLIRRLLGRSSGREGELPEAADRSPDELMLAAEEFERAGRFLDAAHCTQLATLELLLRREWIALSRSEPNRTLRRRIEAGRLPRAETDEFLSLLDRLESRWFRDRREDRELYGAWQRLHDRLRAKATAS